MRFKPLYKRLKVCSRIRTFGFFYRFNGYRLTGYHAKRKREIKLFGWKHSERTKRIFAEAKRIGYHRVFCSRKSNFGVKFNYLAREIPEISKFFLLEFLSHLPDEMYLTLYLLKGKVGDDRKVKLPTDYCKQPLISLNGNSCVNSNALEGALMDFNSDPPEFDEITEAVFFFESKVLLDLESVNWIFGLEPSIERFSAHAVALALSVLKETHV